MSLAAAATAALALARMYLEQGDDKHALRMLRAATLGKSPNVAALVLQVSCFLSPQTVSRQHAPSSIFKQRRDAREDQELTQHIARQRAPHFREAFNKLENGIKHRKNKLRKPSVLEQ